MNRPFYSGCAGHPSLDSVTSQRVAFAATAGVVVAASTLACVSTPNSLLMTTSTASRRAVALPVTSWVACASGGVYQGGARLNRISWCDLAAKTISIDTLGCERCGYSPVRVVAVVAAPTREQLEAVRHPGAEFAAVSWRSRAPPVGQLELPMRQRVA